MVLKRLLGFPTYAADKEGNIYSLKFRRKKKLKSYARKDGYHTLVLKDKEGRQHCCYVSLLVLTAFTGRKKPEGMKVGRVNGDRSDNSIKNLYWAKDVAAIPVLRRKIVRLTKVQVRLIRYLYAQGDITQSRLANFFQVSRQCIANIIARRTWKKVTVTE